MVVVGGGGGGHQLEHLRSLNEAGNLAKRRKHECLEVAFPEAVPAGTTADTGGGLRVVNLHHLLGECKGGRVSKQDLGL